MKDDADPHDIHQMSWHPGKFPGKISAGKTDFGQGPPRNYKNKVEPYMQDLVDQALPHFLQLRVGSARTSEQFALLSDSLLIHKDHLIPQLII